MTSAGTGSLSDYKLNAKKEKLKDDRSSLGFASRTAGDDLEIVALHQLTEVLSYQYGDL